MAGRDELEEHLILADMGRIIEDRQVNPACRRQCRLRCRLLPRRLQPLHQVGGPAAGHPVAGQSDRTGRMALAGARRGSVTMPIAGLSG